MVSYGPLDSRDDVVAYLMGVSEALADGKINLVEAVRELDDVVDGVHCALDTEEQRDSMRAAYKRQYAQRDAARALAAGLGAAGHSSGPGQPSGAGPSSSAGQSSTAPPPGGSSAPQPGGATSQSASGATPIPNAALAALGLSADDIRDLQAWQRARAATPDATSSKKRARRPWHDLTSIEDDVSVHPVVRQTRLLVREYAEDLDATKRDLLDTSNLPALPDSVWRSILKDEYVDLDKIYSIYNTSADTRKRSEKLAEGLWLQTESDAPTKHITSSADWLITFRTYMRGVLIAFPHRKAELETWEDYVSIKFRAYNAPLHKRVIALEAASRRTIFDTSSQSLFNTNVLEQLVPAWMLADGTAYTTVTSGASGSDRPRKKARTTSGASGASSTTRPTCNNWNGKGCTYNGCRYRHVCSACGGDHTKSACTKASSS
jgi:hypothetical protein